MSIYSTSAISSTYVKVRWQEPYVSDALNKKMFGVIPKGIYSGFVIGPGGLSTRSIAITTGSVSGGLGTGLTNGYVSGNYDETVNFSIAVHQNSSGWATTVNMSPGSLPAFLDATGLNGLTVYIVLDVQYTTNGNTTANFLLVDGTQINANPSYIVLGYCQVPSNPSTPLDQTMFGYNDPNFPRLTPLATTQKAGYMPASAWALLTQNFIWQNLMSSSRDPNSNFVIDIAPSQAVNSATGARIYSYIQPNVASKFPRSSTGLYNGGASNNQPATLNLQTGVMGGAHAIPGNLSFSIPSVSGTSNGFQAGIIAIDGSDNLSVTYGSIYSSASAATLDDNLPIVGKTVMQVCGFVVSTNVSGVLQPLGSSSLFDRRPFLNVGGGGSGGASSLYIAYLDDFENSIYTYDLPYDFSIDASNLLDTVNSTGSYSLVNGTYALGVSGTSLQTLGLLSSDFLSTGQDLTDVSLQLTYVSGFVDPLASYQLSRDGGNSFQAVSMTEISTSYDFTGRLIFANSEPLTILQSYLSGNINNQQPYTSVSGQQLDQPFFVSGTEVITLAEVYLNKVGNPGGNLYFEIVADSGGFPSTSPNNVLSISSPIAISSIVSGASTLDIVMPTAIVSGGASYHLVSFVDSVYKSSWVSGVTELQLRTGPSNGTLMNQFNGTIWSSVVGKSACYKVGGRKVDLRLKVTSSQSSQIAGFHVEYLPTSSIVNNSVQQQAVIFSGSLNQNSFTLTNFSPIASQLKVYVVDGSPDVGKVFVYPSFSISGTTVTFPVNTFNLPGQTITLLFDQVAGGVVDSSSTNSTSIAGHSTQLAALGAQLSGPPNYSVGSGLPLNNSLNYVAQSLVSVPNTTIIGRAQIPDLTQDLGVRFGIDRIMIQQLQQLQNEFGPNGEPIFSTPNDPLGLVRFGGGWTINTGALGTAVRGNNLGDFVEITFYGTGLNVLTTAFNTMDVRATVDGGTESANIMPGAASILNNRNYGINSPVLVTSGLVLGVHTVKLRKGSSGGASEDIYGFEIITTSSTLKVNPGTYYANAKALALSSQQSPAYNSTFTSGILGTRGGRVQVYMKTDGTIAKYAQAVATSGSSLSSSATISGSALSGNAADHVRDSEELFRVYYFREFGAGRSDDFSIAASSGNYSFTLDDGTTALVGANVAFLGGLDGVAPATNNTGSITVTFIGTGLDISWFASGTGTNTNANAFAVILDGVSVGNWDTVGTLNLVSTKKICSGLPYGTHTVKIARNTPDIWTLYLTKFYVYGPKKFGLASGELELADYSVMGNFVANSTATGISASCLRKQSTREFVYVGSGWSVLADVLSTGGFALQNSTSGDYCEYIFFGTGFDFRGEAVASGTATLSLQNLTNNGSLLALTSTNFPGLTTSAYSYAFNYSTGAVTTASAALGGIVINGLTLGLYKVRFALTSANICRIHAIDIITPVHSHKSNLYANFQNTLLIGSQGISDDRKMTILPVSPQKAWAQAVGIQNTTITSTTLVPVADMSLTIRTFGSPLDIAYTVSASQSVNNNDVYFQVYIDGVAVGVQRFFHLPTATDKNCFSDNMIIPVSVGVHKVDLYCATDAGTVTMGAPTNGGRNLKVREI